LRTLLGQTFGEEELLRKLAVCCRSDEAIEEMREWHRHMLHEVDDTMADGRRLLDRARKCHMSGLVGDAIQLYKRVLRAAPTAEAHRLLGWAYSFQNRYTDAIRECESAIGMDPEMFVPYHDIGIYLLALSRPYDAIPWLQLAVSKKAHAGLSHAWADLGRAYEQTDQGESAFAAYYRAWKLNPGNDYARKALDRLGVNRDDWN